MIIINPNQKVKITRNQIIYPYGCAIENMSLQAINLGLGSCILCDTLYIENEINEYLKIKDFEQICGFIIGDPIYNSQPKVKKDLKDLLLK